MSTPPLTLQAELTWAWTSINRARADLHRALEAHDVEAIALGGRATAIIAARLEIGRCTQRIRRLERELHEENHHAPRP